MTQTPVARKKKLRIQGTLIVNHEAQLKLAAMSFITALLMLANCYACYMGIQFSILPMPVILLIGVVMMSILIYLQLDLSNRILGPMERLRAEMLRIHQGEAPRIIHLRKGDLGKDLIELFNKTVVQKLGINDSPLSGD